MHRQSDILSVCTGVLHKPVGSKSIIRAKLSHLTHRHQPDDVAFVHLSRADICVCGKGRFGVSEWNVLNVSSI